MTEAFALVRVRLVEGASRGGAEIPMLERTYEREAPWLQHARDLTGRGEPAPGVKVPQHEDEERDVEGARAERKGSDVRHESDARVEAAAHPVDWNDVPFAWEGRDGLATAGAGLKDARVPRERGVREGEKGREVGRASPRRGLARVFSCPRALVVIVRECPHAPRPHTAMYILIDTSSEGRVLGDLSRSDAVHDPLGPSAFIAANRSRIETALGARDLAPALHHGDARAMVDIPDASVHLVATSPPYPLVAMWDEMFATQSGVPVADPGFFDACHRVLADVWTECHRVLVPGGILAIVIGDATRTLDRAFRCYPNHVATTTACEALGFHGLVPILWKKPTNKPNAFLGSGFLPPNAYVTLDCEYVLIFRKPPSRAYAPRDPLRYASAFSKAERDVWFSQIWDFKGVRQDTTELARRTAAYPDQVPERLIRMFSGLGDTVLDPFAGTGATLRVAHALGRRGLGYEIDAELHAYATNALPDARPDPSRVLDALLARYESEARDEASTPAGATVS